MPADPTPSPAALPPTCEVRDWVVFGPGPHKGTLYTGDDCRRMVAAFDRLSAGPNPTLVPVGKVGHDREQRLARSLGLPACGRVVGCRTVDDFGRVALDLVDVPTWFGGQINAGRYKAGSIEVDPHKPDPADPAKRIEGPILTGVAFLGEEQPAVQGPHYPPPTAVFADGTPVPPAADPIPVPDTVLAPPPPVPAEGFSATLCFSEKAMTPEQMKAQLTGEYGLPESVVGKLAPEDVQALWQSMETGEQFKAHFSKVFAGSDGLRGSNQAGQIRAINAKDPDGKPEWHSDKADPDAGKSDMEKMFAKCFADYMDPIKQQMGDLTQRVGSVEKTFSEAQKKDEDAAAMAAKAFASEFVDTQIGAGKILFRDRDRLVREGVEVFTKKAFADKSGDAAVAAWKADLSDRPVNPLYVPAVSDAAATGAKPEPTPLQKAMARPGGFLDRHAPKATQALRQPAGAA